MKIKVLKIISILGGLLLILQLIYPFILKLIIQKLTDQPLDFDSAASIGIIGGADGPTSIFLATSDTTIQKVFFVVCLVITIVPAITIWRATKKK